MNKVYRVQRSENHTSRSWATSAKAGPQMLIVPKALIPDEGIRGRVGFVSQLPFWAELKARLSLGLNPAEAVEICLNQIVDHETAADHIAA